MSTNAVQQIFNPATQRSLVRIGVFSAVGLGVLLLVLFVVRLFKNNKPGTQTSTPTQQNSTGPDGTVQTLPQNLKQLGDDLNAASSWTFLCNDLRCDTLLAMAELPDAQLIQLGAYYQNLYSRSLKETFGGFYLSGCCFREASSVVDAKLKSIQQRVKNLNI